MGVYRAPLLLPLIIEPGGGVEKREVKKNLQLLATADYIECQTPLFEHIRSILQLVEQLGCGNSGHNATTRLSVSTKRAADLEKHGERHFLIRTIKSVSTQFDTM